MKDAGRVLWKYAQSVVRQCKTRGTKRKSKKTESNKRRGVLPLSMCVGGRGVGGGEGREHKYRYTA